MPRTYPNSLLKIYGASTASPCQKCTSLYTFGSEFRHCRNIAFDKTGGIRAAAQRIISASVRRWFQTKSSLCNKLADKKCTGRTFFVVPAVNFFLCLVLALPISKKGLFQKTIFGVSERTITSVKQNNIDIWEMGILLKQTLTGGIHDKV